jgi:hypothetical protein
VPHSILARIGGTLRIFVRLLRLIEIVCDQYASLAELEMFAHGQIYKRNFLFPKIYY